MKKWGWSVVVFLGSLLITMPIGFFLALILLGPHTDTPPSFAISWSSSVVLWSVGDTDMVLAGYL